MTKQYPKYKDSKVKWIGQIPDSWLVSNIRHNAKVVGRIGYRGYTVEDIVDQGEGAISLSPSNIQNQIFDLSKRTYISWEKYDESPEIQVFEGDLILVKTASVGKVAYVDSLDGEKATINPQLVVFKEVTLNPRFLYYYLISNDFQFQIDRDNYGGVVGTLTQASINSYKILVPSDFEQAKIAQYLDYQTAIIDQLIQQKEKLIELLKEKRQAIVNEAVTSGLNPSAKTKESGIDWLGAIPQAWNLVQIRHLDTKVGSGVTPKGGAEVYTEEGVIFIRSQNVHFDGLRLDDVVRIDYDTHEKMSGSKVKYKDVLLNITGASIGRCCVVDIHDEMNVNQHVCIIRPTQRILPEYLNLVLQSNIGQVQIKLGTTGGNREGLTFEAIKEFTIPLPELDEQQEILNKVQSSLKQYYELENLNTIQIDKLKEYRQSIIAEAVTGKIDVRNWQPNKKQLA